MADETSTQRMARQMREAADLIESGAIRAWDTRIVYGHVDEFNPDTGATRRRMTGETLVHITLWATGLMEAGWQSQDNRPAALPSEVKRLGHED